jgi:enamine deaminase RidA (YjgF/YER057c/UK114 family)
VPEIASGIGRYAWPINDRGAAFLNGNVTRLTLNAKLPGTDRLCAKRSAAWFDLCGCRWLAAAIGQCRAYAASAAIPLLCETAMIERFSGLTPTRSRAVAHDDLVFTVAVAPDPVTASMYEQSVKALARIDESLALCGSHKSRILSAIVYITDIKRKSEMNRAWDEWVDADHPPMRACIGVDLEPPHIIEIVVTAVR